jgi:hypothetical protein
MLVKKYVSFDNLSLFLDNLRTFFSPASHTHSQSDITDLFTEFDSSEPAEYDIPKVFITGPMPTTKDNVLAEMTYISNTLNFNSYIEIKCQGTSSMKYPKKNYTVKLYDDDERTISQKHNFKHWGKQSKFCLKANWIDLSHSRNVVSARIWSDIVKSRSNYSELPELLCTSPNHGAIDGFFVKVFFLNFGFNIFIKKASHIHLLNEYERLSLNITDYSASFLPFAAFFSALAFSAAALAASLSALTLSVAVTFC